MDTRSAPATVNGQRGREASGALLERLDSKQLAALERGRKLSLS
jgi:hypothetical protein